MNKDIKRLDLNTPDGAQLNMDALYQIAPSVFTESRDEKTGELKRVVNFDALRQLLGDNAVDENRETYEFRWVGKDAAKAEAARAIDKTLRPVVEDSVDWDTTKNLYIEGDNLEVLKLLQRSYMGKVKMIYIDPPYNTGNDFVYHDDFAMSSDEYEEASEAVDELGNKYVKNTETSGRFHSDWCNMIYPRLMVARSLLSEDGVIFISIDDNEVENLRKICDEVFGETNCIAQLVWKNKYGAGGGTSSVAYVHEYILIYSKADINNIACELTDELKASYNKQDEKFAVRGGYTTQPLASTSKGARANLMYPIEHHGNIILPPKGGRWVWSKDKFDEAYKNNEIVINKTKDGWSVRVKNYLKDENGQLRKGTQLSIITNVFNQEGSKEFGELMGDKRIFDFPKPTNLIQQLLKLEINGKVLDNEIILDFFSGSSSTAHAILKLNDELKTNNQFIMVQLPEETPDDSEANKAGYKNICEIGKERIRRAGKKIKEEHPLTTQDLDTGFRVFRVDSSNFEDVERTPKEYNQQQLDLFANNIKTNRTDLDLLFGSILAWGLQLDLPMQTEEVDGCKIYTVNDGDLVACFAEKVTDKVIEAMAEKDPLRVLFRDSCFDSDDKKINLFETFKQKLDWTDDEAYNNIRVI